MAAEPVAEDEKWVQDLGRSTYFSPRAFPAMLHLADVVGRQVQEMIDAEPHRPVQDHPDTLALQIAEPCTPT